MAIHQDQVELSVIIIVAIAMLLSVVYCRKIKETIVAFFGILRELREKRKEHGPGDGPACGEDP